MKTSIAAILLSAIAMAVAFTSRPEQGTARAPAPDPRIASLQAKVAELEQQIRTMRSVSPAQPGLGRVAMPTEVGEDGTPIERTAPGDDAFTAAVDAAVERKANEIASDLRIKANKKPDYKVFAKTLELTAAQREAAERVIVDGQQKTIDVLSLPTADGSNLMDELIVIVAKGIAEPGKDHGWGKWIGRVMTEKIPGSDETYGTRVEAIKRDMRATFQKSWTPEQYKEFTEWGVDPTEIENVPGTPHKELEKRIFDQARRLGADLPE